MYKILLSLITCLCLLRAYPQDGHQIKVTLKPYKNTKVYLGYYYGKIKALADSAWLNEQGTGSFAGKDTLTGGVYFVVSPHKVILFEMLIDSQQHFSISADTTQLPGSITFSGSPENVVFQQYSRFTNTKGSEIMAARKDLVDNHSKADSTRARGKITQLNQDIQQYREDLSAKYPNSLLNTLFSLLKEPVIPKQPGGKYDSLFAYRYFKSHYWDGISFTDDRLPRTPVFEARLDKY